MLKVTSINNRTDKNGRAFQVVNFTEVTFMGEREVFTGASRTRNLWSAVEGNRGDFLYGNLEVGSYVEGAIHSFETTPYEIDGREVNKTTVVVFSSENSVTVANNQLRNNNASVLVNGKASVATQAAPVETTSDEDVF